VAHNVEMEQVVAWFITLICKAEVAIHIYSDTTQQAVTYRLYRVNTRRPLCGAEIERAATHGIRVP
jgi:hypothetical protein